MTKLNLKIDKVDRDKLYYDMYSYCVHFRLQELTAIKFTSHKQIDDFIERQNWRRKVNYGGSWQWTSFKHPITDTVKKNCHTAHDNLKTITDNYKLITSGDFGYLYLNDLDCAYNFLQSPGLTLDNVKQAVINRPRDSLIIKSAKHNFRTYFRNQRINEEQKNILINFLKDRKDIRLSPSMKDWIFVHLTHRYICDNYFIDHNDDGFLTMLVLVSPVKIKKTLTLLTE